MKSGDELVAKLADKVFSTQALKEISSTLEELALDKKFKLHANAIVSDETLTDQQKKRQLSFLLKTVENSVLYEFFAEEVIDKNLWLFSSEKIDYFDQFVRQFQLSTEEIGVVYLVTAVNLDPLDLKKMSLDLSKSFGYKAIIKHEVNPDILGGAQIRVENMVYDFSLRIRFTQFRKTWLTSLNKTEKLIGRNQP